MSAYEGPPPKELYVDDVDISHSQGCGTGQYRCEEYGNPWDHFKSVAVSTLVTAKHEFGTSHPTLEQYQEAYKKHTGKALRDEAIEHGFRSVVEMLQDVRDLRVAPDKSGDTFVSKRPPVAEAQQGRKRGK
ncbi:hypothetical protein AAVH_10250 [Aphelenchoides avenae]|nr:hypothetical protein AAVH_10250 [Aphelenchus avenae]